MSGHVNPRRGHRPRWSPMGALALALVLPLAWWCARSALRAVGARETGSIAEGDPAPGTVASPDEARRASARHATEATVAARNRDSARDEEAFRKAGWTMVAAPPPDPQLLALDPRLLDGREGELRVQIASTVPGPELASRLKKIALAAHEPATRVAAVEALGRIGTHEAQSELLALLPQLDHDDEARRQIVPLLRPNGLDDRLATELATQLDSPALTMVEKRQLAFTLALVGLRDGMKLPSGALSPSAKQLIEQMTALAQRGSGETQGGAP